tara:strand:- start:1575 stop:3752 length:2178 start_codon:yes stop_codon:yes gene_type:complete
MNNNVLIECRQKNINSHTFNFGDYNTRLSKAVLINEGDSVQISKVFVDNVANTDTVIIIEKDITLILSNYLYVNNYVNDNFTYGDALNGEDGGDYIWCNAVPNSDPGLAGCIVINTIKVNAFIPSGSSGDESWGSNTTPFPWKFEDPFGSIHKIYIKIEEQTTSSFHPSRNFLHLTGLEILCKSGTLKPDLSLSPNVFSEYNVDTTDFTITATSEPQFETLSPILRHTYVNINKGDYTPVEITNIINNGMSKNNIIDLFFDRKDVLKSAFLDNMLNATSATKPFVGNFFAITGRHEDGGNFRLRTRTGVNYIIGQVINIVITSPSAEFTAALTASGLTLAQMVGTRTIDGFNPSYRQGTESDGMVFYNNGVGGQIPVGKPDLDTYEQQSTGTYQITSTISDFDRTKFVKYDSNFYLQPKVVGTTDAFIGSNQMEIDYSTDSNKFLFKYIHFPVYHSGDIISTFRENKGTDGGTDGPNKGKFFYNGKIGGIAWNRLEAYERGHLNDEAFVFNFWEDKLGFLLSDFCVDYGMTQRTTGAGIFNFPNFFLGEGANWLDGVSVTMARPVLDAVVDKTQADSSRTLDADLTTLISTADLTTEIIARNPRLETVLLDYGYYLIEITAGFQNEIVGGDSITQNISGIVNRYYSLGTYTSSEGSSFNYIHKGVPVYLKDIRIRVLDSDKNLATNIGDDNTIFLQIIRGEPTQQEIEQEEKVNKEVLQSENLKN